MDGGMVVNMCLGGRVGLDGSGFFFFFFCMRRRKVGIVWCYAEICVRKGRKGMTTEWSVSRSIEAGLNDEL